MLCGLRGPCVCVWGGGFRIGAAHHETGALATALARGRRRLPDSAATGRKLGALSPPRTPSNPRERALRVFGKDRGSGTLFFLNDHRDVPFAEESGHIKLVHQHPYGGGAGTLGAGGPPPTCLALAHLRPPLAARCKERRGKSTLVECQLRAPCSRIPHLLISRGWGVGDVWVRGVRIGTIGRAVRGRNTGGGSAGRGERRETCATGGFQNCDPRLFGVNSVASPPRPGI